MDDIFIEDENPAIFLGCWDRFEYEILIFFRRFQLKNRNMGISRERGILHERASSGIYMGDEGRIALHAASHPLARTLLERGIPQFHRFLVPHFERLRVQKEHASALEHFPEAIGSISDSASVSVHVTERQNDLSSFGQTVSPVIYLSPPGELEEGMNLQIHIHDLLTTDASTEVGEMFHQWWEMANRDETPIIGLDGAYWCSCDDVAEGLLRLIKGGFPSGGSMNVCGRRYWSMEATWLEFEMLVSRTLAGREGRFNLSHLQADEGPVVEVEDLKTAQKRIPRPSLDRLHESLESISNEGWNPRTPFRQSLMLIVAELAHHYKMS